MESEYTPMEINECILTKNIFNLYTTLMGARELLKCIEHSGRLVKGEKGEEILSKVKPLIVDILPFSKEFEKDTILTKNLNSILSKVEKYSNGLTKDNIETRFKKIMDSIDTTLGKLELLLPIDLQDIFHIEGKEYIIFTWNLYKLIKVIETLYSQIECVKSNNSLKNVANVSPIIKKGIENVEIIGKIVEEHIPFLFPEVKKLYTDLKNVKTSVEGYNFQSIEILEKDIESIRSKISETYVPNYLVLY